MLHNSIFALINLYLKMKILPYFFLTILLSTVQNVWSQASENKRVDGIVGVVGDKVVLESDVQKSLIDIMSKKDRPMDFNECMVFGSLLESKLFLYHAELDSVQVMQEQVDSNLQAQLDQLVQAAGSTDAAVKFYSKSSFEELSKYFREIIENNLKVSQYQNTIADNVEITPEEVKQYFNSLPEEELPIIGDQVEMAEILIEPEVSEEQVQNVIRQLKNIKKEVEEGASFSSKVYLYTEDPGSIETGGMYSIDKKAGFVKEFKDAAFALKEGEISDPFKTEYGYHIVYLEKIRGEKYDVRHILIKPKPTAEAIAEAQQLAEDVRMKILNNEITFEEAVTQYSTNKTNKNSNGLMVHPSSGDTRFELNTITDKNLYNGIYNLKKGELSQVITYNYRDKPRYQIIKVLEKIGSHRADFANDFVSIQRIALDNKKREKLGEWIDKKIKQTYIFVDEQYQGCDFANPWK